MKKIFLTIFIILIYCSNQQLNAQKNKELNKIKSNYNLKKLSDLEIKYRKHNQAEKEKANNLAIKKGWEKQMIYPDGSIAELQRVTSNGKPIYFVTLNIDASKSTRTNHLNTGGSLGLNLHGNNMITHVWDAGLARSTHQEYDGLGGSNRYSIGDGSTILHPHSAHVAGTIMASGFVANAKGMAPQSKVIGYDWNSDESEAISAASSGMLISNHSYGLSQRDVSGSPLLPNYYFGGYITESKNWDEILFNAPYYLMVVAAGNSGNDNTVNGAPLNGNSNFDKLTGHSTSKNNLVVANAQDANVSVNGDLISAIINSSSSEGPTDDLRIKPDITGNGTNVNSTNMTSNSTYYSASGTSMASPNIAGSLLLLQEHWYNLNANYLKSATLKGLALHTADDLGSTGPDAIYGWGLMNSKKAAETITMKGVNSQVDELTLNSGNSYTFTVDSDGINPLVASISWTDRPGTANTLLNSSTPVLVNDLDIRVSKSGSTYMPYRLESISTTGTGDNIVDPFERVDVNNANGSYTITISHKGTLTGGNQNYSLIVTGISNIQLVGASVICKPSPEIYTINNIPSGATVTWQVSSNLQITNSTATTVAVKPKYNYSSTGWIKANLSTGSSITKNIQVNNTPIDPNEVSVYDEYYSSINGNGTEYDPYLVCPNTSYILASNGQFDLSTMNNVNLPYGWSGYSYGVTETFFTTDNLNSGQQIFEIYYDGDCGPTSHFVFFEKEDSYNCSGAFMMSYSVTPNPTTSNELTITNIEDIESNGEVNSNEEVEFLLYSHSGVLKKTKKEKIIKKKHKLNVSNLLNGLYYLKIIKGKSIEHHKIIINR